MAAEKGVLLVRPGAGGEFGEEKFYVHSCSNGVSFAGVLS